MFSYLLDLFKSASCRKTNSLHLTEVASYEDSLPWIGLNLMWNQMEVVQWSPKAFPSYEPAHHILFICTFRSSNQNPPSPVIKTTLDNYKHVPLTLSVPTFSQSLTIGGAIIGFKTRFSGVSYVVKAIFIKMINRNSTKVHTSLIFYYKRSRSRRMMDNTNIVYSLPFLHVFLAHPQAYPFYFYTDPKQTFLALNLLVLPIAKIWHMTTCIHSFC